MTNNTEYTPFYDDNYQLRESSVSQVRPDVNLEDPVSIESFLASKIFGQKSLCRQCALFLWNHLHGRRQIAFIVGESGSGKSAIISAMKSLYEDIFVQDSSIVSQTGWKGHVTAASILSNVRPGHPAIVCYDEFDKLATPCFATGGTNVSSLIQSELLNPLTGIITPVIKKNALGAETELRVDTSTISYIFIGSWQTQAKEYADKISDSGFGFGTVPVVHSAYEKELTREDLIKFGVLPELAGRINKIISTRPLSDSDYRHILTDFEGSPVKRLEADYGIKINLKKKRIAELAAKAASSGLGTRTAINDLTVEIDNAIYDSFEQHGTMPTEISL